MKTSCIENNEHHLSSLQEIKRIESKDDDEVVSSYLFNIFNVLEWVNAFFATITMVTSAFNKEFKNDIRYANQLVTPVYTKSLESASKACLIINSASVLFFSKVAFKISNNYHFALYHVIQITKINLLFNEVGQVL